MNRQDFCLENDGEKLNLKRSHKFHYQVQLQLASTERQYCNFIVWVVDEEPHIERVSYDECFFDCNITKAEVLFKTCTLTELLGKWYSVERNITAVMQPTASHQSVCFSGTIH